MEKDTWDASKKPVLDAGWSALYDASKGQKERI